jgi:hypothetical protein
MTRIPQIVVLNKDCAVTDNARAEQTHGPTKLETLGLSKMALLEAVSTHWRENTAGGGPGILDRDCTVAAYLQRPATFQSIQLFPHRYLSNTNNPCWFGRLHIDPDDEILVYTINANATDFTLPVRLRIFQEIEI